MYAYANAVGEDTNHGAEYAYANVVGEDTNHGAEYAYANVVGKDTNHGAEIMTYEFWLFHFLFFFWNISTNFPYSIVTEKPTPVSTIKPSKTDWNWFFRKALNK